MDAESYVVDSPKRMRASAASNVLVPSHNDSFLSQEVCLLLEARSMTPPLNNPLTSSPVTPQVSFVQCPDVFLPSTAETPIQGEQTEVRSTTSAFVSSPLTESGNGSLDECHENVEQLNTQVPKTVVETCMARLAHKVLAIYDGICGTGSCENRKPCIQATDTCFLDGVLAAVDQAARNLVKELSNSCSDFLVIFDLCHQICLETSHERYAIIDINSASEEGGKLMPREDRSNAQQKVERDAEAEEGDANPETEPGAPNGYSKNHRREARLIARHLLLLWFGLHSQIPRNTVQEEQSSKERKRRHRSNVNPSVSKTEVKKVVIDSLLTAHSRGVLTTTVYQSLLFYGDLSKRKSSHPTRKSYISTHVTEEGDKDDVTKTMGQVAVSHMLEVMLQQQWLIVAQLVAAKQQIEELQWQPRSKGGSARYMLRVLDVLRSIGLFNDIFTEDHQDDPTATLDVVSNRSLQKNFVKETADNTSVTGQGNKKRMREENETVEENCDHEILVANTEIQSLRSPTAPSSISSNVSKMSCEVAQRNVQLTKKTSLTTVKNSWRFVQKRRPFFASPASQSSSTPYSSVHPSLIPSPSLCSPIGPTASRTNFSQPLGALHIDVVNESNLGISGGTQRVTNSNIRSNSCTTIEHSGCESNTGNDNLPTDKTSDRNVSASFSNLSGDSPVLPTPSLSFAPRVFNPYSIPNLSNKIRVQEGNGPISASNTPRPSIVLNPLSEMHAHQQSTPSVRVVDSEQGAAETTSASHLADNKERDDNNNHISSAGDELTPPLESDGSSRMTVAARCSDHRNEDKEQWTLVDDDANVNASTITRRKRQRCSHTPFTDENAFIINTSVSSDDSNEAKSNHTQDADHQILHEQFTLSPGKAYCHSEDELKLLISAAAMSTPPPSALLKFSATPADTSNAPDCQSLTCTESVNTPPLSPAVGTIMRKTKQHQLYELADQPTQGNATISDCTEGQMERMSSQAFNSDNHGSSFITLTPSRIKSTTHIPHSVRYGTTHAIQSPPPKTKVLLAASSLQSTPCGTRQVSKAGVQESPLDHSDSARRVSRHRSGSCVQQCGSEHAHYPHNASVVDFILDESDWMVHELFPSMSQ